MSVSLQISAQPWHVLLVSHITWNQLEYWIALREQTSYEQLFRLDIERVRIVNNRSVRTALIANHRSSSKFPLHFLSFINLVSRTVCKFALLTSLRFSYFSDRLPLPRSISCLSTFYLCIHHDDSVLIGVRCIFVPKCLGCRGCRYNRIQGVPGATVPVKSEMENEVPRAVEYSSI